MTDSTTTGAPVLLLGASIRALAESVTAAGLAAAGADLFADRDTQARLPVQRVTNYPAGLFRFARRLLPAAWIYGGGLENYPRAVARLAATHELLGNDAPVLRLVRDPRRVADWAQRCGLATPQELDRGRRPAAGDWVAKTRRSSGGLGVRRWRPGMPRRRGERLQRWVEGCSGSAVLVSCRKQTRLIGATWQLPPRDASLLGSLLYTGSCGPATLPQAATAALQQFGAAVARDAGIQGAWGVDFVADDHDRLHLLEINPRWTASVEILERAADLSLTPVHIAACRGDADALERAEQVAETVNRLQGRRWWGKRIVYSTAECRAGEKWRQWVGERWTSHASSRWQAVADIGFAGDAFQPGQPVCTVFQEAASRSALVDSLAATDQQVRDSLE